jgi:hypothetical protein
LDDDYVVETLPLDDTGAGGGGVGSDQVSEEEIDLEDLIHSTKGHTEMSEDGNMLTAEADEPEERQVKYVNKHGKETEVPYISSKPKSRELRTGTMSNVERRALSDKLMTLKYGKSYRDKSHDPVDENLEATSAGPNDINGTTDDPYSKWNERMRKLEESNPAKYKKLMSLMRKLEEGKTSHTATETDEEPNVYDAKQKSLRGKKTANFRGSGLTGKYSPSMVQPKATRTYTTGEDQPERPTATHSTPYVDEAEMTDEELDEFVKDEGLDEMSTSAGAGPYSPANAFSDPRQKKNRGVEQSLRMGFQLCREEIENTMDEREQLIADIKQIISSQYGKTPNDLGEMDTPVLKAILAELEEKMEENNLGRRYTKHAKSTTE